ncbi:MAG: hypothetical protein Q8R98_17975, partial [Rubrivivax sp.]|nr:hypothetical protein [Rubrivivax sp.]
TPNQLLRQAERYVGLPYQPARFTCAHLAVQVQKELFNREVGADLPRRHPVSPNAQHQLIETARAELAELVAEPETGDAVLFKHAVHVQGTGLVDLWHVGTLFLDGLGQAWVLHTHAGAGSVVLELLASCKARGLRLDGFYRWKVAVPQ